MTQPKSIAGAVSASSAAITAVAATAAAFVDARRMATPLLAYPGALPLTLDAAYAIQDQAIAGVASPVAGWKVGRIWPPFEGQFGSDRLAGPIFANQVFAATDATLAMPVFAGGFAAVEAEFVFVTTAVDPARRTFTLADAAASVRGVHIGIEIASSPLAAINDLGPAVTASDFGNNNGLIVGPAIADWQDAAIDAWPVAISIDGAPAGTGISANFPDGALGSVRFLLELLARRGIAIPSGTLISTGAITGVHPVSIGQRATARFDARFELSCRIAKAAPVTA